MSVRIFKPTKTAMQSGRAKTEDWVLEHIASDTRSREPLMGYNSSSDMNTQVSLSFETLDEAVGYAEAHGLDYVVVKPKERKIRKISYADNFKYGRLTPWTH